MKKRHLLLLCILITGLLLIVAASPAQAQTTTCPALAQRALTEIGSNCVNQSRNSACYGFNQVSASFLSDVPTDFFTQPTDRTGLDILDSLQTAALNEAAGIWGVATMNVQANLPNALPGQSAVYILLGDAIIENDVPAAEALLLPDEPLRLTAATETQLRHIPALDAESIGSAQAGEMLFADGISADLNWVRVFFIGDRQASAWAAVSDLEPDEGIDSLPVITPESRTPMQAFRFQTSLQGVSCEEAPSAVLVQGPQNIEIDITANGADIRVGSLIMLTTNADGTMTISVLSGASFLNPDSPDPIFLPAGFSSTCDLADIVDGDCEWSLPEPFTDAINQAVEAIRQIFALSPNLFNYVASPPRVVCASSVSEVVCEFIFDNPSVDLALAQQICLNNDSPVCDMLFP